MALYDGLDTNRTHEMKKSRIYQIQIVVNDEHLELDVNVFRVENSIEDMEILSHNEISKLQGHDAMARNLLFSMHRAIKQLLRSAHIATLKH